MTDRDHEKFAAAARDLRARRSPPKTSEPPPREGDLSLDALWHKINDPQNRPTPQVTVEAVIIAVRERGMGALKEPATAERLAKCDQKAKEEIRDRIKKLATNGMIGKGKPPADQATKKLAAELADDPAFQRIWQPAVRKFHGRK